MTRWEHFKHVFGQHDWRLLKEYDLTIRQRRCGPHDPSPVWREVPYVDAICCVCGEKKTVTWREWVGI